MVKAKSSDGIEIHWDERSGYLSLACEPEAFETFRRIVRDELKEVPEIPLDQVLTVEISDTTKVVARHSPNSSVFASLCAAALFFVGLPWIVGIVVISRGLR